MEDKLKMVFDSSVVHAATQKMAAMIQRDVNLPLTFVIILKGGAYTGYSILNHLGHEYFLDKRDIIIGHIGLSSYEDGVTSQGYVKVMSPLDLDSRYIEGRNVVIVDDCIESGGTLHWAKKIIGMYNPESIHTVVLVDKVSLREKVGGEKPDIVGLLYQRKGFLVGGGMGKEERYRELSGIYEIGIGGTDASGYSPS